MVRIPLTLAPADARLVRRWLLLAFAACGVALLAGALGTLAYARDPAWWWPPGLTLQRLRPLHTACAVGWIFLAGWAVLHAAAAQAAPDDRRRRALASAQWWCWCVGGIAAIASLAAGYSSGREYLEFHPACAIPLAAGWLCGMAAWGRATGFRLRGAPVYVYMWNAAQVLFCVTFVEAYLWLLPGIGDHPIRDVQVQWKAYGSLVGSFNLIVYGAIAFMSERLSGDRAAAQGRATFGLFFLGLLNSLTNFAHHTYHVPQSPVVKWVSFVVSMGEFVILLKVLWDCVRLLPGWATVGDALAARACFAAATAWTALQLVLALALSIPPINTFLHGTHVVTAHAMGSMLGIDSMILWGCAAVLLPACGADPARVGRSRLVVGAILWINVALVPFWGGLVASGLVTGVRRYLGPSAPALSLDGFPLLFGLSGAAAALGIGTLLGAWTLAVWRRSPAAAIASPPPAPT